MLQFKVIVLPFRFIILTIISLHHIFMPNFGKYCSIIPIKQVLEARSDLCLLAEFPPEGRLVDGSSTSKLYLLCLLKKSIQKRRGTREDLELDFDGWLRFCILQFYRCRTNA